MKKFELDDYVSLLTTDGKVHSGTVLATGKKLVSLEDAEGFVGNVFVDTIDEVLEHISRSNEVDTWYDIYTTFVDDNAYHAESAYLSSCCEELNAKELFEENAKFLRDVEERISRDIILDAMPKAAEYFENNAEIEKE